jgi:hypothetical protein
MRAVTERAGGGNTEKREIRVKMIADDEESKISKSGSRAALN